MRAAQVLGLVAVLLGAALAGFGAGHIWLVTSAFPTDGTGQKQGQAQPRRSAGSALSADYVLRTMDLPSLAQQPGTSAEGDGEQEYEDDSFLSLESYDEICALLFSSPNRRDVSAAISKLQEVAGDLEKELPLTPAKRKMASTEIAEQLPKDLPAPAEDPLEAEEWLVTAGTAAFVLAALHATGIAQPLLPRDDRLAVTLTHQAAMAGSALGNLALMDRYTQGRGVPKSCTEGLRRGRLVADALVAQIDATGEADPLQPAPYLRQRWRDASYAPTAPVQETGPDLGLTTFGGLDTDAGWTTTQDWSWLTSGAMAADPAHALGALRAAALDGDPQALTTLGHLHMRGMHLPRNMTRARVLLLAAAELGSGSAYNALGIMHLQGLGIPANHTRARQLFEIGASMHEPDCFYNLAVIHSGGYGMKDDPQRALDYLLEAHDLTQWRAPYQLALMHGQGRGSLPANCSLAVDYLRVFLAERTAMVGDIEAAVGALDQGDGWGALVRMALVAEQGDAVGQGNLAWMLQRGLGYSGPDRHDRALEMHLRAGEHAHMPQELVEAGLLLFGPKLQQGSNRSRAAWLWRAAAQRGDVEGRYLLGWMAESGSLGPANLSLARSHYRAAVAMALDESEAFAPFVALLALHVKGVLHTIWAILRLLALLPGVNILASGLARVVLRCWGAVLQVAAFVRLAAVAALQWEMSVLTLLCCGLATVLWVRKRMRTRNFSRPGAA